MRKSVLGGLLFVALVLLASQDPYLLLPEWVFVAALAVGVVCVLLFGALGLLTWLVDGAA